MAEPEEPTQSHVAPSASPRAAPADLEVRTMHVFISRALQKILREASKKQTALRQACTDVIEELKNSGSGADVEGAMSLHGDPPLPVAAPISAEGADAAAADAAYAAAEAAAAAAAAAAGAVSPSGSADDGAAELEKRLAAMDLGDPIPGLDRFFVPLRLACECKVPKIMEMALHCIQKIIAYGYVRGKSMQGDGAPKLMMEVVMETICACKDEEDKDVQLQIVQAVNTAVTSSVASVHDTTLLLAVKTCFYIYLVSKNATIQKTANATLTQMLDVVFARLESPAATSMAQKDAFLVFRSLCKLSMKPLPDPLPSDDSIELRSKLLSLQLLYAIILKSGPGFRSGEKFIWAIRQYLCLSLLKNGVSTIPSILQLSLDIFVTLIRFFKEHLKSEIGVFFSNILLRILESSNSSGQQKQLTIQALQALVAEPQLMVDLFLNYDCDLEGKGIFTSMCDGLSRLTLNIQALSETTEQDAMLKQLALETLVLIADSMVQWEREVGREPPAAAATPPALSEDNVKPEGSGEAAEGGADAGSEGLGGRGVVVAAPVASGAAGATALGTPLEAVDFEAMFHRKHEVQEGVIKFNMKPKRGIKYLMDVCGLENTPAAVARFLRSTEGLDKRSVGDYLGEGEDFSKQVLYAYVDSIDFADSTFDAALRKFLSLFWLPGEAQKIDRMMEKFAERYCSQNEGVFANADTAYVLAYSLIMLNTDAHSSQIKKKMTQQEFVNMNRGINDSGDLPTAFLESLYQAITTHEIKIKEFDPVQRAGAADSSGVRASKSKLFHMESALMVKQSQELFKAKARVKSVYHSSRNVEHARPMFETSWCALLASWTSVMEESADDVPDELVNLVMRGFANAVHIAAEFGMHTEREAFVTMLAKYTYLDSHKTMGQRNIESFKTLVSLALTDGNHLGSSWAQVLKCLSEFQRLHMIGTGAKTDASIFFPAAKAGKANGLVASRALAGSLATTDGLRSPGPASGGRLASSSRPAILIQPARIRHSSKDTEVEMVNSATMVDSVDVVAIDRIFSGSAALNPDAIVEFVTHLCNVSREELDSSGDPQVYALQKIVEVAYYNMARVRYVWARIWEVLSDFFTEVGQHPNLSIAMYSVDSLRQLATKFLEKEELLNYQFQREFLKPFQDLMTAAGATEVKELVIVCLTHMVQSRARSIRSGWSTLFATLTLAAADPLPAIAAAGYALASRTVADHFAVIGDHHTLGVECVAAYLRQQSHTDIALSAARCLADYARLLHDLAADAPAPAADDAETSLPPSVAVQSSLTLSADPERLWWPLCEVLAQAIGSDVRPPVRAVALTSFFGVLEAELAPGGVLHGPLGLKAFRELALPIFDAVQPAAEQGGAAAISPAQAAWFEGTGLPALTALERAFCRSSALLAPLLDDVIALFVRCLQQPHHPRLSRAAAESLLHVVRQTGASFSQETWALVCAQLQSCFDSSAAEAFAAAAPAGGGAGAGGTTAASPLLREVSAKVEAEAPEGSGPYELQVLLLSTVYQLLQSMYPSMTLADVEGLLNCMLSMYDKAAGVIATAMGGAAGGAAEGGDAGAAGPSAIELEEALHLKHEAMAYYLQLLFLLYAKLGPGAPPPAKGGPPPPLGSGEHVQLIAAAAEYRLVSFCLLGLRDYLSTQDRVAAGAGGAGGEETFRLAEGTLAELTPNIVMLLRGVLAFPEPHFSKHLPVFYPLFADLIHCESKQIAAVLREIFAQRIAPHLQQSSG